MPKKKKKKKPQPQKPLSPQSYLASGRARNLPIYECLVETDWQNEGWFILSVARKHINENITFAAFFIDLQCIGIKEVIYGVNVAEEEYLEWKQKLENDQVALETCEYNLAHNIIYEAISYADQWGIEPHQGFSLAQHILAEDNDSIPLMEIPLGVQGMPKLIYDSEDPRNEYYLQQLDKHAGPGNFMVDFANGDEEEEEDYVEEMVDTSAWKREEWEDFIITTDLEKIEYTPNIIENIFEKELNANGDQYLRYWQSLVEEIDSIDYKHEEIADLSEGQRKDYDLMKLMIHKSKSNELKNKLQEIEMIKHKHANLPAYQYLYITALQKIGDQEKADDLLGEFHRLYPNHVSGHLAFLHVLIRKGKADQLPEFMTDPITLKKLLPDSAKFNVYHYLQYLVMMCEYFYQKDNLGKSYLYRNLLFDIDVMQVPPDISPDIQMFNMIDHAVTVHVKSLIGSARLDSALKEKLVKLLVEHDVIIEAYN